MVFPFVETILIVISSILIVVLLSKNRNTSIFRIISYASISFYILILFMFHISGYINLFFKYGIKKPFFAISLIFTLLIVFLFIKKKYYRNYFLFPEFKIEGTEKVILYLYCLFYACLILYGLFSYPNSFDGNYYHLPLSIKFLQSDSLSKVPPIWQFSMPSNAEVLFSYFSSFRMPKLLNFSQMFLLIGLIIWTLDFNRQFLKLNQSASFFATIILLSMPAIFQGIFWQDVDMFGAAFLYFSVTIALLILVNDGENRIKYSFLSGLFYGISVGTKLNFIVFAPIVGSILLYVNFWGGKKLSNQDSLKLLSSFIVGFILFSSFWFVRNYFLFANPLYPLDFPFLNLKGVPIESIVSKNYELRFIENGPSGWILFPFTEKHPTGRYVYSYGPLFAIVVIPSYIISLGYSFYTIQRDESKNLILLHIISAGCILLWFFFLSRQPRFIMIAPMIMVFAVGYAYEHIITNKKRLYKFTVLIFSGMFFILYSYEFISTFALNVRYKYTPFNWEAYYRIPVNSDIIREKGIINLGKATMNFPLYGPNFSNEVITSMEVYKTLHENTTKQQIDSDISINMLYRKYGDKLIYSDKKLSNKNIELYKSGIQAYPNIKGLDNYIYKFNVKSTKN